MNFMIRLFGLTLLFTTIQFQSFGQKEFNKIFFPKNKAARWLMSHWGAESNVKTLKKFNKKFDGEEDLDYFRYNYQAEKNKLFIKLNSADGKDGIARYDGLFLERRGDGQTPITFAGATIQSEIIKNISGKEGVEIVENKERQVTILFHPMKICLQVYFDQDDQSIYSVEVSGEGYEGYYKEVATQKAEAESKKILAETDFRFDKTAIHVSSEQVRPFNPTEKVNHQIINIIYKGDLKNGVPHGSAKWGIFEEDTPPRYFDIKVMDFVAEGTFEEGNPVGEHKVKISNRVFFTYTYEAGRLKKMQEVGEKFYIVFKEDGSYKKVAAMPFDFGSKKGLLYYGEVDENLKPHDSFGTVYFDNNEKVSTEFVHGNPKKGAAAYFTYIYDDVVLTAQTNGELEITGKVEIRGTKKGDEYSGFVYMQNGQPDLSKNGELTFENFKLSNDLEGKFQVNGKIQVDDFGKRLFGGKDLTFSFAEYPDTKFKGDLKAKVYHVIPTGWHAATEGGSTNSLRGKYAPSGEFLEGDNFYQKKKAWIYDSGYFTDNRNGRKYLYSTYIKENGDLLTWMLEDLHLEDYTNQVWGYGSGRNRKTKCYYSKRNSKIACPSGWRLPTIGDVDFIKKQNTQDKKYITNNTTLISILSLDRNGYVRKAYRGTEMYQEGEGVYFWLNTGKYISISKLNQGSFSDLNADNRFHTCRCVKDGVVKNN